jgi:hypothetical protein
MECLSKAALRHNLANGTEPRNNNAELNKSDGVFVENISLPCNVESQRKQLLGRELQQK